MNVFMQRAIRNIDHSTNIAPFVKQSEQKYQFWTFNQFLSVIYERFYATGNP